MEKASDVYNKLKLRFVGKGEMAAKPKTENKELEDNGETKNTGKEPDLRAWIASIFLSQQVEVFHVNPNLYFLDSTPINGDTEQKMDDMEVEDKPKSPAREENNDDTASSPNRWMSCVKRCTGQCVAVFGLGNWQAKQVLHNKNAVFKC